MAPHMVSLLTAYAIASYVTGVGNQDSTWKERMLVIFEACGVTTSHYLSPRHSSIFELCLTYSSMMIICF